MTKPIIRGLIIDDESAIRKWFLNLSADVENLEIIGQAKNADEGLNKILELKPDVIFLDIEMPLKNGFQLIDELLQYKFNLNVVFVTAFDKYALKAIKYAAFDYLLKPVSKSDLSKVVLKLQSKLVNENLDQQINKLLSFYNSESIKFDLRTGYLIIEPHELVYCEAEGNYTVLYLHDGKKETVSFPIGKTEENLPSEKFFRISRSVLVNLSHVKKINLFKRTCEVKVDHLYHNLKISKPNIAELKKRLKILGH
jgi:two-component system LytT family response regulator